MQLPQVLFIHHKQHGGSPALLEPLGYGVDAVGAYAVTVKHQKVEIVSRGRRIRGRDVHLDTQRLGERTDKIMQARCARHEQHGFLRHIHTSDGVIITNRQVERVHGGDIRARITD